MVDVVFSNPPYNKNVDIKILKEITPLAKELVVVHPSTWLIDIKRKKKLYNDFRDKINGKLKSVEMFNGNKIFNIGLNVPIVITYIDNEHNGECDINYFGDEFTVDDIYDITKFGKDWKIIVKPFMNKIKNWCDNNSNVWEHRVEPNNIPKNMFSVQFSNLVGTRNTTDTTSMVKNDFYTITLKDKNNCIGIRKDTMKNTYMFTTEKERDNFLSYCQTDFARFCVSIYKDGFNLHNGAMSILPYMDFSQSWDDKKLYKYFNIDKKTQEYITNFLPDYHNIRSTNV